MATDISIEPTEPIRPRDLPLPPASSEPELVYHYAGVNGLRGIIEGQCLWASDVWYMNDAREALYGFTTLQRALQAFESGTSMESDVRQAALDRLATMENKEDFLHSYIACLSTKAGRPQPVASLRASERVLDRLRSAGTAAALPAAP